MQTANILLALGGDSGNQVPKFGVTAAEIAVLRAIHGEDAVTNVLPLEAGDNRTNRTELARLRARYGAAQDGEGNKVVGTLFPGAAARVFETIDELELPEALFAGKGDHDGNGRVGGAAPVQVGNGLDSLKVPELRQLAEDRNIDLGDATKKADIIAKIEAAAGPDDVEDETVDDEVVDEDEDGVEDLSDNGVLG